MTEWNNGRRGELGMLGGTGQDAHDGIEALLTAVGHVPVLRTALHVCHGHAEAVHGAAERRAAEEHFLGHVLMAVEHGAHLADATRQPQAHPRAILAAHVVENTLPGAGCYRGQCHTH